MVELKREYRWLEWCSACMKKHVMHLGTCSGCDLFEVSEPASEAVYEKCHKVRRCDGCEAYEDRYR